MNKIFSGLSLIKAKFLKLYDPAGSQLPYRTELNLVKVRRMVYLGFFLRNPVYLWSTFKKVDARSIFTFLKNSSRVLLGYRTKVG